MNIRNGVHPPTLTMANLRQTAELLLATTLEDPTMFGLPVSITYANGSIQSLYGQVTYNTLDQDGIWQNKPAVTLRLSTLTGSIDPTVAPIHVKIPATPSLTGTMTNFICDRPIKHGKGLGIITLFLTAVDQTPAPPEPPEEPGD